MAAMRAARRPRLRKVALLAGAALVVAVAAACTGPLNDIVQVSTGYSHACAVTSTGKVLCWGNNGSGQLGDGSTVDARQPVEVTGLSTAVAVAAGSLHTCALTTVGDVYCWGGNPSGQLGTGTTVDSTRPMWAGVSGAASLAAGDYSTCAVLQASGQIRCWGENGEGQLGDGTTVDRWAPVAVVGVSGASSVSAGSNSACATFGPFDQARCWGSNTNGQLGNGTTTNSAVPVLVGGPSLHIHQVAVGDRHVCGRTAYDVWCWGSNSDGQLGQGGSTDFVPHPNPLSVTGLSQASLPGAVSAGQHYSCAVRQDGFTACWGTNDVGQLGDGTTTAHSSPVGVSGIAAPAGIDAGGRFACAVVGDGVRCWGQNNAGQLGDGSTVVYVAAPVVTKGQALLDGIGAVDGGYFHTCAVVSGSVRCWGYNGYGQLGNGSMTESSLPVTVTGITNALAVASGANHSCALLSGGVVECWGKNLAGQLGDGTTTDRSTPVGVGVTGVVAITAGADHTCALIDDGTVECWGYGDWGQLGFGAALSLPTPVPVVGISDAVEVSAGENHTCARLADGTVRCWGINNFGQIGQPYATTYAVQPASVPALSGVTDLDLGADHSCVVAPGGVQCWGRNDYGQLGDGTTTGRYTPASVVSSSTFTSVSAGAYHNCALQPSSGGNNVICWGANYSGQLGYGGVGGWSIFPTPVLSVTTATGVSAGGSHTCATLAGSSARCWGRNDHGMVGNGTTAEPLRYPTGVLVTR